MELNPGLPWLARLPDLARPLAGAHALLLHGAPGDGLFEGAMLLARAWLCEASLPYPPCGRCDGCRLLAAGAHPDLMRLMPEALRAELGDEAIGPTGGAGEEGSRAKRKPSQQIRIDEVRGAIEWVATTASRDGIKLVLIHPSDAMNVQAASALLKTLEEPPKKARLLLTAAQPDRLLATVRSRCQVLRLPRPGAAQSSDWLRQQGVVQPEVMLAAASSRPLDALAWVRSGVDAARWAALPNALLRGPLAAWASLPLPLLVQALLALAHDGLALAHGSPARFFPPGSIDPPANAAALAGWTKSLQAHARRLDHPWNEGLLVDTLLQQARAAWRVPGAAARSSRRKPSDTLPA